MTSLPQALPSLVWITTQGSSLLSLLSLLFLCNSFAAQEPEPSLQHTDHIICPCSWYTIKPPHLVSQVPTRAHLPLCPCLLHSCPTSPLSTSLPAVCLFSILSTFVLVVPLILLLSFRFQPKHHLLR